MGGKKPLGFTYLILKLRNELLVTWQDVCTVLNETTESPQSKRWLSIFLDDVEMLLVDATTRLASFLDDRVHTLREGIVENWQRGL